MADIKKFRELAGLNPGTEIRVSRNWKLIPAIIGFSATYWLVDALIDAFMTSDTDLIGSIFTSGYRLWLRLAVFLIFLAFGIIAQSMIKKHELLEKAFEKIKQQLELILNSAGEGIYGLDPLGGVTFVNAAALRISGYEANDMIGRNVHDILHHRKTDGTPYIQEDCPIFATLRDGEPRRITDEVFWTKQGKPFPVEYVSAPIEENGRLTGAVVVFRDISARRQAEQELKRAKDFLENVFDNSADAIGVVDADGRFTRWNKAAERTYGYNFEEIKEKHFSELYADKEELEKMMAQLRRDGFVRRYQIKMHKKDGSIVPFGLSVSYLRDQDNKVIGSVCLARDRSDIDKAMGEMQALNQQLRAEILEKEKVEEALEEANVKLQGMVREVEQRNRDVTFLNELGDLLQACVNREEAYAAIAQYGPKLFPEERGMLAVINVSKNLLEAVALWGDPLAGEQVFSPEDCWAFRRGESHQVKAFQQSLLCKHLPATATTDYLCIPMAAQGEIMGLLHIQGQSSQPVTGSQAPQKFLTEAKQHLAVTLAKQISLALASVNLREDLRWQAIRDPLTGLFNRRYMEESLEREVLRVQRRGAPLGVIMIDLDQFKHFNDTFGHKAGDAMLVALAGVLKAHIRREDIACRYGGEELLVILPETPMDITVRRAELMRQRISHLQVELFGQPLGSITASLGVANFPDHGTDWEQLIQAADAAMYQAKQEGRNRVAVAQKPEPREPGGQPGLEPAPRIDG